MRTARAFGIPLLVFFIVLIVLAACARQDTPLEPAAAVLGELNVAVVGLPEGVLAAVTVTGPRNFSRELTRSEKLQLSPGRYELTAQSVSFLGETYQGSVEPPRLVVRPREASSASVSYTRGIAQDSGELVITVSGLPEGLAANATVSGPEGYRSEIVSSTILKGLEPGTYTLSGFSVLSGDTVWIPRYPSVSISVEAGEERVLALEYLQPAPLERPEATDWREEIIYFAMTDRFKNGDPTNDSGARRPDAADEGTSEAQNPLGWHGGDFAGLQQKIEAGYFQEMGFTAIWISPVYLQVPAITVSDPTSPNDGKRFAGYHGYWAEDFFQVDPHFGSFEAYQQLVLAAREHGLRIIQDMVVNHTGYDAELTRTHPHWFHTECTSVQSCPLAGLPDLDDRIPEVQAFLNAAVRYWVENFGIDGIRMDTVKHVYDEYWQQFFALGGPGDPERVWTVGEIFDGNPSFLAHYMDTLGLPAAFDFPLYFRIKDHLSHPGGNLNDVAVIFDQDKVYSDPTRLVTFVDNHDVPLFMSEAKRRGVSEAHARERLDAALSFIYMVRGTPSVYYGTELARLGLGDPYSHEPFAGNRVKMDFEAEAPLAGRLARLAEARREYRALTHGAQDELWRPHGGAPIYAFRRSLDGEAPVVAVLNNGDTAVELSTLHGGGIPLLGTFASGAELSEITGRVHNLTLDASGRLVGTVPPRTLLAVSGAPGVPEDPQTSIVTFTVDARSQGAGELELRRFDTGSELRYPMTPVEGAPGFWETTLTLERNRTISFKFGNSVPEAKNWGYEGPGQPDRTLFLGDAVMHYSGVYDFITISAPTFAVTGTVSSSGTPLRRARVDSSTNASLYYAFTFGDGSYYLPHPEGTTSLTAQAAGYGAQTLANITVPASDVNFDLSATTKYVIDGNLSDWSPQAVLTSPNTSLWGENNDFIELLVDWDEHHLYLGYRYRAWGNSVIVYLDVGAGGSNTPRHLDAWPRRAAFATPVNHFLAQYEGQALQLRRFASDTHAPEVWAFERATTGTHPAFTTEVAIPWSTLGYSERPSLTLNIYAGIFGGDHYGAGDIAPNANSSPAAADNYIDTFDANNAVFRSGFSVLID